MNKVLKTKLNKKGFTLAELLVVVAIIAVLVAVSIPVFTAQLDKAKQATDDANARAAKGAAVTTYLADEKTGDATYYYDAESGTVKASSKNLEAYGKTDANKDKIVKVEVDDGNAVDTSWEAPAAN